MFKAWKKSPVYIKGFTEGIPELENNINYTNSNFLILKLILDKI